MQEKSHIVLFKIVLCLRNVVARNSTNSSGRYMYQLCFMCPFFRRRRRAIFLPRFIDCYRAHLYCKSRIFYSSQITLYQDSQPVLTTEKGVTLGLLKLIYSSDSASNYGFLFGVKSRQGPLQRIISNDTTVLDSDEYDLIVQGNLY